MDVNPILPVEFVLLQWAVAAMYLAIVVWALVTLAKANSLTVGARISWLALIVIVPFVGSAAWLGFTFVQSSRKQTAK
ncbi:PLDc N-terminal domain-containing protein [Arthrobacter glacialis]|uniref:PLDc N-terminal domain-containing protein n=1 Tax=Arthrobacter glacialis TaxID=1664 RepID=UPI000CD3FCC7|nr:PLDc N-terminal domain-containing protein [Arthrobacter glacialis]POH57781.1 hypothetical protein CVS28_13470 [Arthrobacter glacialis]